MSKNLSFCVLAALVLLQVASATMCPRFVCETIADNTPAPTMLYCTKAVGWTDQSAWKMSLSACPSNQLCMPTGYGLGATVFGISTSTSASVAPANSVCIAIPSTGTTTTTTTYVTPKRVGETCSVTSDCYSTYCNGGKCDVKAQDASCSSSLECGKMMKCMGTCKSYLADGSTCDATTICKPSSSCGQVGTDTTFKCWAMGSQAIGTKVVSLGGLFYNPLLCSSYNADLTTMLCKAAETTNGGFPRVCSSNSDCSGTAGSPGLCSCMYPNIDGYGSCSGQTGDMGRPTLPDFQNCYPYEITYQLSSSCTGSLPSFDPVPRSTMKFGDCFASVNIKIPSSNAFALKVATLMIVAIFALFAF